MIQWLPAAKITNQNHAFQGLIEKLSKLPVAITFAFLFTLTFVILLSFHYF
jgi:hypothetical protein